MYGSCKLHVAGKLCSPAQTTTNKERNKSLVSPVCHEDFGITDIILQVIAKLPEKGSNISTEVMEVRAILELLGSLKAFDHWPCASNQQLLSTAIFVDLFQSSFSTKTHSLKIGNQLLSVQDCLVISLLELIWVRISTSNLPIQCYKSFVKKSGIRTAWCIATLTHPQATISHTR